MKKGVSKKGKEITNVERVIFKQAFSLVTKDSVSFDRADTWNEVKETKKKGSRKDDDEEE